MYRAFDAYGQLPWPQELKDSIWMERVRLRQHCKGNMKDYKQFWNDHGENFEIWFLEQPIEKLKRCFQLPRQEVLERLKQQNHEFHNSFGTLLCGGMFAMFSFLSVCPATWLALETICMFLIFLSLYHT
jgi:hypothetical protein